jgi:uncharacterized membrane protein YesL
MTTPDNLGQPTAPVPYRPSVIRALRKSVADAWLYLGLFIAVDVTWVVLLGLPLGLLGHLATRPGVLATGVALTILTTAAGNAILFHITNCMAHGEASVRDFTVALSEHFLRSLALLVVLGAIVAMGAFNVFFYLKIVSAPWWRIIGMVWGYVVALFALAMLYSYPVLVEHKCGPFTAIKRSGLLFLDNPAYTLGLGAFLAIETAVVALPLRLAVPVVVGLSFLVLCFIQAGFVGLLANNALLELLRKYELPERKPDAGGGVPGDTGG